MRALCVVLAALLLPATALAGAGKVSYLEGTATRTPKDGAAAPLALESQVEDGDAVETAAGSRVEVALADGSLVRLNESSKIVVDSAAQAPDLGWRIKLTLALGQVWAKVTRKVGADAGFEVHTERVVAGVRGTEFLVSAAEDHQIEVYEGEVDVGLRGVGGVEPAHHRVRPGHALRVDRKGRTEGPRQFKAEHSFRGWVKNHEARLERERDKDRSRTDRRMDAKERREHRRDRLRERREERKERHWR
jgi:hypothetical protein